MEFKECIIESFKIIEKSTNCEQLEDWEKELKNKLDKKNFIDIKKYPRIAFRFNDEDLDYFRDESNQELASLIGSSNDLKLTPREKLMLSMLWKNGDLGKEKHIINGLLNKDHEKSKKTGQIFHQFGRKLKSPDKEPIIDQHILRAFKYYQNTSNTGEYAYSEHFSKQNSKAISDYKDWITENVLANKPNPEDYLYYTDRILFGIGKYLKPYLKK
ncbi:hypothetical protein NBT05_09855 [Aquimarina sp. ERC-38]|uniref:hypothetical protein n=1 Tax=Aquimarina sp. ERC-38 TaxID=2949996 RepID=UPI002247372B|nr:hypothetical protein [Aquimarina sp. ERC-38]UZO79274.1 hypothetical protein NBT05_09855 [Aquimarina sp. ERC-38]